MVEVYNVLIFFGEGTLQFCDVYLFKTYLHDKSGVAAFASVMKAPDSATGYSVQMREVNLLPEVAHCFTGTTCRALLFLLKKMPITNTVGKSKSDLDVHNDIDHKKTPIRYS